MIDAPVRKRWVFHVPGYDPAPPAAVKRRFAREIKRFEKTWSVWAVLSRRDPDDTAWAIDASGPNWNVQTQYRLVDWSDVIAANAARPAWWRIPKGLLALVDFGLWALPGYFGANWRYALFFLYPFLVFAALVALSAWLGAVGVRLTGSLPGGIAIGLAIFALQWHSFGRHAFLNLLFDDWIFSYRYVRHGDPELDAKLDGAARELVEASRSDADEVVVIGHSLGAVLAIDLLDRALQLEPELGRKGARIGLVSVGSSILKVGLHRAAHAFRAATRRVAGTPGIFWSDYQAISDIMNFYKRDPLTAMGMPMGDVPLVQMVRIRHMLDPEIYRRIRFRPLRMHLQFVSGNNLRNAYDYFMLVCGPLSIERQARSDGALHAIGPDGALIEKGSA